MAALGWIFAQAVIMCYDITNYEGFENLDDRYRLVVETFADTTMPHLAMVGNKCEYDRVTSDSHRALLRAKHSSVGHHALLWVAVI